MSNNNFDPVSKIKNAPSRFDRALNKFVEVVNEKPEVTKKQLPTWQQIIGGIIVGILAGALVGNLFGSIRNTGYEQGVRDAQTTLTR